MAFLLKKESSYQKKTLQWRSYEKRNATFETSPKKGDSFFPSKLFAAHDEQ